jgi:phenylacetate-coenzyme A ligase PaaK-like adenylate-forming protein
MLEDECVKLPPSRSPTKVTQAKQVMAETINNLFEGQPAARLADHPETIGRFSRAAVRKALQVSASVRIVNPGELPRSFAKSKRLLDERGDQGDAASGVGR